MDQIQKTPGQIIASTRDGRLASKEKIFALLSDLYKGGENFIKKDYLLKYPKEDDPSFELRKQRSFNFNIMRPLVDLISSLLFTHKPKREYPEQLSYLEKKTSRRRGLSSFMRQVMAKSSMFTVGVLVDSPKFDPAQYPTKASRPENLNPYACLYDPCMIRDFYMNDDGELEWVLLDNSYLDKSNPTAQNEKVCIYRLWTKKFYQDWLVDTKKKDSTPITDEIPHIIGYVPFHFVNWVDVDDDIISDSSFEDVAIINKTIYNWLTLMDEQIHLGTFKTLFYPSLSPDDVPETILKKGIYSIPTATFNGNSSQAPFYGGSGLSDADFFIKLVDTLILAIFRTIGMDQDRDKTTQQSGVARERELTKVQSLLVSGKQAAEETEAFIIKTAARWENQTFDDDKIKIEYDNKFLDDNIDDKLRRLYEMFSLPYKNFQDKALEKIAEINLPEEDAEDMVLNAIPVASTQNWLDPSQVNNLNEVRQ